MLGLLIKDIYLFKRNWFKLKFVIGFLLLLSLSISLFMENSIIISIFITMFFLNSVQSLFTSDLKSGWITFLNTTALSPLEIVLSRFLSSLVICIFANIISLIVNILLFFLFRSLAFEDYLLITLLTLCISVIYIITLLPFIYLLDQNGLTMAVILVIMAGFLASRADNFVLAVSDFITHSSNILIALYTACFIIFFGVVSFCISTIIYKYRFINNKG